MRINVGDPAPIEGATVWLDGVQVGLTDSAGTLSIPDVAAGPYTIAASKEPYFGRAESTFSAPETTSVTLVLPRTGYSVGVATYDVATGSPVVASIYVDGGYVGDTTGPYASIDVVVPPGSHEFRARKDGYVDAVQTVTVDREGIGVSLGLERAVYTVVVTVQGSGPIEGAEVFWDGVSVGLTGADGSITITEVTAGSHTVRAEKEGYSPASATVSVPETTSVTLTLEKLLYDISFSTNVWANIYLDGAFICSGVGVGTITGVERGTHTIEARADGYYTASQTFSVPETLSVTLTLTPITYTVVVTVQGSGPIEGARVYLDAFLMITDSAGRVTFPGVVAGPHTVKAYKEGYESASKGITVPETTSVTLSLRKIIADLEGWVVDAYTKEPIEATVTVAGISTTSRSSDGYYLLTNLPTGTQTITASAPGYEPYSLTREIRAGKNAQGILMIPIYVPPPPEYGDLEGYVHADTWGNAVVEILETGQRAITLYDPPGYYLIKNIPVGTYTVRFARVMFKEQVHTVAIGPGMNRKDVTLERSV